MTMDVVMVALIEVVMVEVRSPPHLLSLSVEQKQQHSHKLFERKVQQPTDARGED